MQVGLEHYSWSAGVATDLVNTAPGVWSGVDMLPDPVALARFLGEHAVDGYDPGASDVAATHRVRERLRALIDDPEPERLVRGAGELAGAAGLTLAFDASGRTTWHAVTGPDCTPAQALALVGGLGILGVVHALGAGRFRPCDAPTCSGAFIDTSRPGRRRYCMPDVCGNRINVANHRARHRSPQ